MLRATIRTKLYRIPGASRQDAEDLLPGERSRLRGPLTTYGSEDDPDEFGIRERVPEEFSYGETPQKEGKRARKIEEAIAEHYDGFERVEDGDSPKTEGDEE